MNKLAALFIAAAVVFPTFATEKKVEEAKVVETAKKCECKDSGCKCNAKKPVKKCKAGCKCSHSKAATK